MLGHRRLLAWLVASLAGACAGGLTPRDRLVDAVNRFCDDVRWQRYDQASTFLPPERRRVYLETHDGLADLIDVTDVELVSSIAGAERGSATMVVTLSWIGKSDPVVHKTVLEQTWELRNDAWWLAREKVLRGDMLPTPVQRRRGGPASGPSTPEQQPR